MTVYELRIGNYIIQNEEIVEVEYLSMDVKDWDRINGKRAMDCEPIPLTEEWLLQLGFTSNPYQDRYEFGDINVECDKTKGETLLWIEMCLHIKFIHQLQNYVFASTGKELELS